MHSSVCSVLYIIVNKMIAHHICFLLPFAIMKSDDLAVT